MSIAMFVMKIDQVCSNCKALGKVHPLDHRKSKRVPEKHLFLLS